MLQLNSSDSRLNCNTLYDDKYNLSYPIYISESLFIAAKLNWSMNIKIIRDFQLNLNWLLFIYEGDAYGSCLIPSVSFIFRRRKCLELKETCGNLLDHDFHLWKAFLYTVAFFGSLMRQTPNSCIWCPSIASYMTTIMTMTTPDHDYHDATTATENDNNHQWALELRKRGLRTSALFYSHVFIFFLW